MTALAASETEIMASGAQTAESQDLVTINSQDLRVGQTLILPLFDDRGVLLLAEGSTITPEFKRLLNERQIRKVQLHAVDAAGLGMRPHEDPGDELDGADEARIRELDELIDSGGLFIINSEAAVLRQLVMHGCKDYDATRHNARIEENQGASTAVDLLMQDVLRGKAIDAKNIARLAAKSLADLTEDIDCVVASVFETIWQTPIADHCVKMALLGMAIGIEMGLDAGNVRNIGTAAMLHDWGMARVSQEVRDARRILTEEEFCEIKKHPIFTIRLLERLSGVPNVVPLVCYQVHERPNGRGYPRGLESTRIHLMAKILNVADTYNALVSPRPFRPALTRYAAMKCILHHARNGDVDPLVARALLTLQSLFPVGSHVILSDGSTAQVLRRNGNKYCQPIVRRVQDTEGKPIPPERDDAVVDLGASDLQVTRALPTPGREEIELNPEIMGLPERRQGSGGDPSGDALAEGSGLWAAHLAGQRPACSLSAILSVEHYSEKQRRQARWVLDMLDNSSLLASRHYGSMRQHERKPIRTIVSLWTPNPEHPVLDLTGASVFRAYTRDVSGRGLSFILPARLVENQLIAGLRLGGGDQIKWFQTEVVRCREIVEAGFWEYGAVLKRELVV